MIRSERSGEADDGITLQTSLEQDEAADPAGETAGDAGETGGTGGGVVVTGCAGVPVQPAARTRRIQAAARRLYLKIIPY